MSEVYSVRNNLCSFQAPWLLGVIAAATLSACGGGGGGGNSGGGTAAPTVTLSASPTSVSAGGSTTLSWSSTNATSCSATGGWSGTRGASGSEVVSNVQVATSFSLTCSGAGGTSTAATSNISVTAPTPTASISASPTSVAAGGSTTLTWSSTNATSCTASGSWSGAKNTSGNETIANITANATYSIACNGAGGTSSTASANVTVATAGGNVTIAGKITHGRVPFSPGSLGLNYAGATQEPSRGITVQAINATTSTVIATGSTDANGDYSLTVPSGTNMFIRAIAQMLRDSSQPLPRWRFEVRDLPTASEVPQPLPPLYQFDGPAFDSSSAGAKDVAIPVGINAVGTATGTRASAPFAILDTVYRAYNTILTVEPQANFASLIVDWSPDNTPGSTFFTVAPVQGSTARQAKIVLSADLESDTDEFDVHVIAHEFGHYVEEFFSRADSIGGPHSSGQQLDLRLAFGEGYGYAFAGFVLGDPVARDSFVSLGQQRSSNFNMESNSGFNNPGWYNESSNWVILWDLFDAANEPGDGLSLGLTPIWQVLTDDQRTTDSVTSVFSFVSALKTRRPADAALIDQIVAAQSIVAPTINAFGTTETNAGNPPGGTDVLPIFTNISANGTPVTVRSVGSYGTGGNKLSTHRFLRLDMPMQRNVRITVTAPAGRDADIFVYRRGVVIATGTSASDESFATSLAAGTYVLDVYDCENAECSDAASYNYSPVDITVTVTPQ